MFAPRASMKRALWLTAATLIAGGVFDLWTGRSRSATLTLLDLGLFCALVFLVADRLGW